MMNGIDRVTDRRTVLTYTGAAGLAGLGGCIGDAEEEVPEAADEDDTVVTFWHSMSGVHGEAMAELVDEFNDLDNGVFVDSVFQGGYGEGFNTTMAAAREGDAPDLVQFQEIRQKNAIDSGLFEPIALNLPDHFDEDDYFDYALEYCTFDGELMTFPSVCAAPVLYYNEDILSAAGVDAPPMDATFADVRATAEGIVEGTDSDRGIVWNLGSWYIEQWFAQQDQVLVNNANGREGQPTEIMFDTDAGYKLFEWWEGMHQDGLWLNVGTDFGQGIQSFISEDVGMAITSTSALGSIVQDADFEVGTSYMPVPEDSPRAGTSYGGATFLTRSGLSDDTELSEGAGEFVLHFNGAEQQAFWHRKTGYQPNNVDAVEILEGDGWFEENPNFVTAFEQFQTAKNTDATAGAVMGPFPEVRSMMDEDIDLVLDEDVSVDQAIGDMKSRIDERLQEYAAEFE